MSFNDTDNSRTSQLVSTLIPKGEIEKDKENFDVSKCYVALYKYKKGRKCRSGDKEYNFDIFKEFHNAKLGPYYKSIDNKLVGFLDPDNSMNVSKMRSDTYYDVNCCILSANKFDSVRLLMYHSGLIKAYVPGKATKEEIEEVIVKMGYLYQAGVSYLPDDFSDKNGRRR